MKIKIKYTAQLKKEAGVPEVWKETTEEVGLEDLLKEIAAGHNEAFANILFDEHGSRRQSIVVVHNNEQVLAGRLTGLKENDEILIMSPIAGG